MKHVMAVSKAPPKAQSGLCQSFESDLQVQLCFLLELLTQFFLPVAAIKNPEDDTPAG